MSTPALVPGLNKRLRQRIYEHVFANDDHEVGGILVGQLGASDLPLIRAAIPALEADGQRASVTFTHEAWAEVHETLDRDYPNLQIVGWYHSHPGFGIFLSEHDRFIHANFFSEPRQVAYVIDPQAGSEGVFSWQDGELSLLEERATDRPGSGPGGKQGRTRGRGGGGRRINLPFPWQYGALCGLIVAVVAAVIAISLGGSPPVAQRSTHPLAGATASARGRTGATTSALATKQRTPDDRRGDAATSRRGAHTTTAPASVRTDSGATPSG